jgi:ribonuclease HII
MVYPSFEEEKKLWKQGFNNVAGLDEAGRGPLAGPVVAAAVCFAQNFKLKPQFKILLGIKDSKKLSPEKREKFYKILTTHPDIKWGVGVVSEKIIDKINILEATKLAMNAAIKDLSPDFLLLDGNFKIYCATPQKSVVAGDAKVFSCCAAGIIAKVTRDKLIEKYHKKYPQYGFLQHKGYGTKAHFAALEKFGPCKIHRKTFWPVSKFV